MSIKKHFLSTENLEKTVAAFRQSEYSISAIGHRGVGVDELTAILKILTTMPIRDITKALTHLYKYHPATIDLLKYQEKQNCENFNEDHCDCYLPDIDFEHCYCKRERRKKLESGDYRNVPEYKEWRNTVFSRDEFTCTECGAIGGILNAHHIKKWKDYPSLRYNIDNGTTLCISCHKLAHKKGDK